ncbi:serine hydrolase domain-containing protein [Chryseobacterium lathyri]|uniref:serine hydrolase domain-containing protein n=1 Tax=Chryseobacterium lathyri TaxID=395933 RepID=UPI0027839F75|nr:serine hydrolase domain-containing protein [Chryseobacterium lathyri]MDQ0065644.1 CubicO group peptidase (beta-lactamase class C family) [Chryseobacterium lathyri]
MRIYFLLLLIALQLSAQHSKKNVDEIIHREMKERKIPGLQLAVVQNGKIILSQSYGIANLHYNIPVSNSSIFPINSNTKVFTGVAVMQLVEQNKIRLDDSIGKYLDDLPAEWQKITVDQLLTHISDYLKS